VGTAGRTFQYLPVKWIAARVQIGTAKGAKSVLHRSGRGQHKAKPERANEPCAQLEFQSTADPREEKVSRTLRIPLYYTGKATKASASERDGTAKTFKLDRQYYLDLPVSVPARGVTWFVVE
jgi:hypothetical protein